MMLGKLLQMMDAEGHQHGRHDVEARLQVVRLVVEEDVRPDGLEKRLLVVVGNGELFGIRRYGMFEPRREAEICVPAMVRLYEKCLEKGVVEGCRV